MLDIFPEEIWCKIIFELPCYRIIDLCKIRQFKELCDKNNLIERRKLYGFPRKTGHCLTHNVEELITCDYEDLNDLLYGPQDHLVGESPLDELIDDLGSNLIRGDIIYYEDINIEYTKYIFDGCNIIHLDDDFDEEGHIPSEFTVINNDVPIDYWIDSKENQGFPFNTYVWFNHDTVREQLIDNAKIDSRNDMVFTKFIFNNKEYTIIFNDYHYSEDDYSLENFKDELRGKKLLLEYLRVDEIKKLFNFDKEIPDSVLYLNGIKI